MITSTTTAPVRSARLLPPVLKLDAAVTALNGAGYLVAASLLDDVLGLPAGLLRGVGVFLVAYGAGVWAVGTRPTISAGAVAAVVAGNLLWVTGSLAVAILGWGTPTTSGTAWIVLQAAVVGIFAALQWKGIPA
jgi:hypothetical protein